MNFTDRLKKLMSSEMHSKDTRVISQTELAAALHIDQTLVSKWVRGVRQPSMEQIVNLAIFFGVTTDYLLGVTEEPTTKIELRAVCDFTGLSGHTINSIKDLMDKEKTGNYTRWIIDRFLRSDGFKEMMIFFRDRVADAALADWQGLMLSVPDYVTREVTSAEAEQTLRKAEIEAALIAADSLKELLSQRKDFPAYSDNAVFKEMLKSLK